MAGRMPQSDAPTRGSRLNRNARDFVCEREGGILFVPEHQRDRIEYALMAGFVAVAAGAIMPGVSASISTIFSKISSVMSKASTQG